MNLNLRESRRSFTVRKVAEPPVPGVDPQELGIDAAGLGQVTVLLSADIYDHLHEMKLSRRLEEGGFLLGKVRRVLSRTANRRRTATARRPTTTWWRSTRSRPPSTREPERCTSPSPATPSAR